MKHSVKLYLRHFITPHHTNNYRSKALHIDALTVYAVFLLIFHFTLQSLHTKLPDVLGYATDITVENLLQETNARRTADNLQPLRLDSKLSQAAATKARHMFANDYWAHIGTDGKTPWDFIISSGYEYAYAGENLAKNFMTSSEVVDAWIASKTHRDNILKTNYEDVGFAVVNGVLHGEEVTLVVQMFGTPLNESYATRSESTEITDAAVTDTAETVNESVAGEESTSDAGTELAYTPSAVGVAADSGNPVGNVNGYTGVHMHPLFDIRILQKTAVYVFFIFLIVVLLVDAFIVVKNKHVRIAGHNISHLLFFGALLLFLSNIPFGSIL